MTTRSTTRGCWLLLDPPSSTGYARRASLREKDNAPDAPFPSIDLILLSGAVRSAGYTPVYLDAQIRGWSWERLLHETQSIKVQGVVSLLSSSRLEEELERLQALKTSLSGVPIYVVASIYTALHSEQCAKTLQEHPWLEGMILNTAENNFADIIVSKSVAPKNVALRRGDDLLLPRVEVSYGEGLRIPRPVHALFKDRRYYFPQSKRAPVTCVQMSFGCPFTCEFCLDNALYRRMRYRQVDDVIDELVEIDRLGFREVYFKDLTFGLHKRVTTEFLATLAGHRLRLRWLCSTRLDVATPRLLRQMQQAGCYGIEFGVESGLRHRRESSGKPVDDAAIHEVFQNCRDLGIETTAFVMIGFEDETEPEIRTTMRFVESIRPDYVSYNIVNALPGTALERRARQEGFLRDRLQDHSFARSNIRHQHLSLERLEALRSEAMRSFYRKPRSILGRLARLQSLFELRKLIHLSRAAG